MPDTQYLSELIAAAPQMSDDAYAEAENAARAAIIDAHVRSVTLAFDKAAAAKSYAVEDDGLYLGSHVCGGRAVHKPDGLFIELHAAIDPTTNPFDFLVWVANTVDDPQFPIWFCPFCGISLYPLSA